MCSRYQRTSVVWIPAPEHVAEENAKTSDAILEYLLAVSGRMAKGDVRWCLNRCPTNSPRLQVARMGADAAPMEGFWLKYGHEELLPREDRYRFFFRVKHTPPQGYQVGGNTYRASVARARG